MTRQEVCDRLIAMAADCRPGFDAISDLLLEVEDVIANEAEADAIVHVV